MTARARLRWWIFLPLCVVLCAGATAMADQITDLLDGARKAYENGNYSKALEDINWVERELLRRRNGQLLALLPDDVPGFTADDPATNDSGFLGIGGVTREYRSASDSTRVEVAIITAQAGGQSNPMSALVNFAAMAANTNQSNAQLLTIGDYRGNAIVDPEHGDGQVVFGVGGQGMVKIECDGCKSVDVLKAFADKIDFAGIERALK